MSKEKARKKRMFKDDLVMISPIILLCIASIKFTNPTRFDSFVIALIILISLYRIHDYILYLIHDYILYTILGRDRMSEEEEEEAELRWEEANREKMARLYRLRFDLRLVMAGCMSVAFLFMSVYFILVYGITLDSLILTIILFVVVIVVILIAIKTDWNEVQRKK